MGKLTFGRVIVLAEMANAHEGKLDEALAIVDAAAQTGADAIKFQLFTPDEVAVPSFPYYEMYQGLQMPHEHWRTLVDRAHGKGLLVFSDVLGVDSLRQANELGMDGVKIHAADVSNTPLLIEISRLELPVLLSCGGSLWTETAKAIKTLRERRAPQIVLVHGFQSYPTKLSDSHLRRIELLRRKFELPVGFAGHVDGGSPEATRLPLWAAAAGADLVEVHITLDRSKKGYDWFSSLDPEPFTEMISALRGMEAVLGTCRIQLADDEKIYRAKHKKWLVATRDINAGEELTADNIALKRIDPAPQGAPLALDEALGKRLNKTVSQHQAIQRKDLRMKVCAPLAVRAYSSRLFGKPLQNVGGKPIVTRLLDQFKKIQFLDEIVLAVSDGPDSKIFIDYAEEHGYKYVIGCGRDVQRRLIAAADSVGADIMLRATSENPFLYWENIDELVQRHIEHGNDVTVCEGLPIAAYVEVLSTDALKRSHENGDERTRSELVTLFIGENQDQFQIERVAPPEHLRRPEIRFAVDDPRDLLMVRKIWDNVSNGRDIIPLEEIIEFWDANEDVSSVLRTGNTLVLWADSTV